jgi:CRISPR-associated protein Csm4
MTYSLIKLHFRAPLHISRGREQYESSEDILGSDAIKSALFACGLELFGADEMGGETFFNSFRISSGFPFCGEEVFFPKPMARLNLKVEKEEAAASKTIKKLRFLGKKYFEGCLAAKEQDVPEAHWLQKGRFISDLLPKDTLILKSELQQRVQVPAWGDGGDAKPYALERIYFGEAAGLFFLTDAGPALRPRLEAILRLLGDNGIGTDRSVGNGQFEHEWIEDFSLQTPEDAGHHLNLSLYLPTEAELKQTALADSAYLLKRRGGWIASAANHEQRSRRKQAVFMFSEGSVFSRMKRSGRLIDLKPEMPAGMEPVNHPVWRDGQALFIPIIKQEEL